MVQSNLNRNLSRKEPGITRKGGILPYSFPAGFEAPHAPTRIISLVPVVIS